MLNGSDTRALSTIGAFRVVSERDLRDARNDASDLRHLEHEDRIQRVPLNEPEHAVALRDRGRGMLGRYRDTHVIAGKPSTQTRRGKSTLYSTGSMN
jgi:hypothetical protein